MVLSADSLIAATVAFALAHSVTAHGRLSSPPTRDALAGTSVALQNRPIGSGVGGAAFSCRKQTGTAPNAGTSAAVTVASGDSIDLTWSFTAAHVGDCAVYLSYDAGAMNAASATWFKIANLKTCEAQNGIPVSVTIPSGLPASNHAVLRWEWYSLQQGPTTPEFYANCVDIEITSTVAEGGPLPTPRCTMGGWLPIGATGSYRNAYGRGAQFITGPKVASFGAVTPCVTPTTFQCAFNDLTCDCGSSSAATRACPGTTMNPPVGGATAAPSAPPTTLASCAAFSNADCQTHTVNAGDTLSGIVAQAKWTKAPYTVVTVAQVASINGIVDPSSVDVGDTLTIPQPGCCDTHTGHPISVFASTKNGGSDGPGSSASSANTDEVDSLKKSIANSSAAIVIFIILFVAALIWAAVASVIAIVMHKKTLNVDERHHEIITAQGGGGVGASVELSSEAAGAGGDAM